jgi:hypothetical protein
MFQRFTEKFAEAGFVHDFEASTWSRSPTLRRAGQRTQLPVAIRELWRESQTRRSSGLRTVRRTLIGGEQADLVAVSPSRERCSTLALVIRRA